MSREVAFNHCASRMNGWLNIDLFPLMQSLAESSTGSFKNNDKTCHYLTIYYYTLNSLSVFSLATSLKLILETSATYRFVSYLLADNWLSCEFRVFRFLSIQVACDCVFVVIFFKTMYKKTILRFGFWDIINNQGLGKCYRPRPSARLIPLTSTLII